MECLETFLSHELPPSPPTPTAVVLEVFRPKLSQPPSDDDFQPFFARYDRRLRQLAALRRRLRQPLPDTGTPASDLPQSEPISAPTFLTCFGRLSFDDLYQRTRKYAAALLHHSYHVAVADVDDGLQAGYLVLWQRLQQQPDLLEGKSLAWIGKLIAYAALHATRGDWQFKRRAASREDEEGARSSAAAPTMHAHSRESRRADVRLDLQTAIAACAEAILAQPTGKQQRYDLWALYGLTMLQVCAAETSRLFAVREQSMQVAYTRVRGLLQQRLRDYTPRGVTTPVHGRGQKTLPRQDVAAIRKANGAPSAALIAAVRSQIAATQADTMKQDLLALAGIQQGIPAQTQARAHGLPTWRMQRAYERVHLLLGAQRDPTIRVRRPERRVKSVFTLTDATAASAHQLALEFLEQPKSYEKLVALHAHISNLAISTTAKHFNIPTSTLRFYAKRIGAQLGTPTRPAREV
jgi:hypothetical protein